MAVNQVTVNELLQISQGSLNVGVQTVRTTIDYSNRKIISLQKHLQDLKGAYTLALQNINRNMTKEQLDQFFSPDRFQTIDPTQVIKPYDTVGADPDARINRVRRRLDELTGEQKKELNRLDDEIKKVSGMITYFTSIRDANIQQLALMENANVISARDNIARLQYEIIYILEDISKRYLNLSTDANGNRIHSSSPSITRQYKILQDAFRSFAARDPDVQKGTLKLLLEDPGAPENRSAIKTVLDRRAAVLANSRNIYPDEIQRFKNKMDAVINDSFISQNVSRQITEKRLPATDNAVTTLVDNLDKKLGTMFTTVNNILSGLTPEGQNSPTIFGQFINASFDSTGFSGAVTNWFNRVMQNNYDNVPLCGVTDTATAQEKAKDNANKQQAETDASQMVSGQLSQVASETATKTSLAQTALADALTEVVRAINEPAATSVKWNSTLTINRTTYTGTNYYESRVLDKAGQATNKAISYKNDGSITDDFYQNYIVQLQKTIDPICVSVGRSY